MKKFFKYVLFGALAAALAVGFTGCYGEDIDNLQEDVANIKADISEDVVSIWAEIARLNGIIAVLQQAIENQNTKITQLENDLDLDNPNSAISLAIAQGDLATLNAAKAHAEGLFNALNAQIGVINGFLGLNTSGNLVVAEAAPNDMLNGTYANLNAFVRALAIHLATLKGQIDANAANIAALQTAVGANTTAIAAINSQITAINGLLTGLRTDVDKNASDIQAILGQLTTINNTITDILSDLSDLTDLVGDPAAFWADDLGVDTVWEAIGYNYAQILAILNRLDNLGGENGRTLEEFVEDVDAFMEEMNEFMDEINDRFDGFADGETIIDMIEKFVGDLTSTDNTVYPDATSMINGEIAKLDEKLTDYIDDEISDLRDELTEYIDEQLALLKEELLGKAQDMVTGLMLVMGTDNDNSIVYDENIGYAVIKELEDRTFGRGGEIVFNEGYIVLTANPEPQPVLVKVTPDHADISGATFVLFDSTKRDYLADNTFTKTVARYNGGVLTRAVTETGLWVVTFTINSVSDFPKDNVLLSLGIVNNMAEAPAADRIISTGPVIDASTTVAPYTPIYYRPGTYDYVYMVNYKDSFNSYTLITGVNSIANSGPNDVWATVPSVDPATGILIPGTIVSGDNRSGASYFPVFAIGDGTSHFYAALNSSFSAFRAWYVEFKSTMPAATTEADWGEDINVVLSTDNGYINRVISIEIPENNALHREVVEFNLQGVNIDATLVDPDGVPFTMGIVAPNYTETEIRDFTVELDDTYLPGDWNDFFDTAPIPFDINGLGFTPAFMQGLTATYSIELEPGYFIDLMNGAIRTDNPDWNTLSPDGTPFTNQFLGVMEANVGGSWTVVDGMTPIDWSMVTEIRFIDVDPKAMKVGEIYPGTLILTEDPASTIAGLTSPALNISAGQHNAITLSFPITITLGEDLTFDLNMMNYKQNTALNHNIIIWPDSDGGPGATYDLNTTFDFFAPTAPGNVVFTTNPADTDFSTTGHMLTLNGIYNYLSLPQNPPNQFEITASYTYGPVFGGEPIATYGGGDFLQIWDNNNGGIFTIEPRNRMDWLHSRDANLTYALATIPMNISATLFIFDPMNDSGMGSTPFTLADAVAQGWLKDPSLPGVATIETVVNDLPDTDPTRINKYFTLSFNPDGSIAVNKTGGASISPGESVTLGLNFTIVDQFGRTQSYWHTMVING